MSPKRHFNRLRGAATVEIAMVAPIILLFMAGGLEIGRSIQVKNVCEEAARVGCCVAIMEEGDANDTRDMVNLAMGAAGLKNFTIEIDPPNPKGLSGSQPVTVLVSIPYDEVSFFSFGILEGRTLTGTCTLRAEGTPHEIPSADNHEDSEVDDQDEE